MRASIRRLIRSSAPAILAVVACVARSQGPPHTESTGEILYLQVLVNGLDKELIVRAVRTAQELYLDGQDLVELGFALERLPAATARGVPLSHVPGLDIHYDATRQLLELKASDEFLATQRLSHVHREPVPPNAASGLVFDYAVQWQTNELTQAERTSRQLAPLVDDGFGASPVLPTEQYAQSYAERNRTLTLASGLRWFSPWGFIQNRGFLSHDDQETRYIRDDTFWAYSSPETMRSYIVGDFIGAPLAWTRALRLGGVRISRNFGLRPDLVTFALPALGGSAVVPTTVDLYVNGRRQFSGQANPGPFVITDAPPLTGAGQVSLVYRDAHGREVVTRQPLYVDTRLLETGLMDYDFEYGYARRNYGTSSFDYAEDPGAIGSLRYGINDGFTLEAHTELADAVQVYGLGGLLKVGNAGVISAAVSGSNSDQDGWLTSAGYQYIAQRWSLDLYDRRTHSDYRDLGTLENVPVPRRLTTGILSLWVTPTQALSANYADQVSSQDEESRFVSLGYRGTFLEGRLGIYANVSRDLEDENSDGYYVGFTFGFGTDATAYSSASRFDEDETGTFGMTRPVDYDRGGFGWELYGEKGNQDYQRANARLDYRAGFADMALRYEQSRTATDQAENVSFFAQGSLVAMRGGVFAARAIYDGFALVSTNGLPGVPVLRENRPLGRTNDRGYLLVPDLPSWRASKIGIDLSDAPVDVASVTSELPANPRGASGTIVDFPVKHITGATLILVDGALRPLPPGTRVHLEGSDASALVGYDGQVFFAELSPSNRLVAELDDGNCEVDVEFDAAQAMKIVGPFVCEAPAAR